MLEKLTVKYYFMSLLFLSLCLTLVSLDCDSVFLKVHRICLSGQKNLSITIIHQLWSINHLPESNKIKCYMKYALSLSRACKCTYGNFNALISMKILEQQTKALFEGLQKYYFNQYKQLWWDAGRAIEDTATLADLGVGPNGTVQIEIQSSDPVNNPIRSYRLHQEYQMPDVITVRVQTGEKLMCFSHVIMIWIEEWEAMSCNHCWCVDEGEITVLSLCHCSFSTSWWELFALMCVPYLCTNEWTITHYIYLSLSFLKSGGTFIKLIPLVKNGKMT